MDSTKAKRGFAVFMTAVLLVVLGCAAVMAVQFCRADLQALAQRGVSRQARDDFGKLELPDGLFDLPEMGTRNTEESRVNATFMVSQMAGENYPKVGTWRTLNSLYDYAQNERKPLAMRLKAYVALKNFKDQRWEASSEIVRQIERSFPEVVTKDNLAEYLSLAEPVMILDLDFTPITELTPFDPLADEQAERLATSALISKHLFSNKDKISGYFSELRPKLCAWAGGDSTYIQQTLLAADALTGTSQSTCTSRPRIEKLLGCRNASRMIAVDGSRTGTCSLTLTYYAFKSGAVPL
ncbi:hypothetical protein KIH75_03225 [Bifidobacterium sp. 64T4]|uniref:hypothetical protein n=1 Tax=Bifidobacterium pongonis TaxID=2834432 RepID=UPI001C576E2B|nr:hypothetical protein [Bifidobacterium pongonis]MBW3094377.1 hypothetical protein [Bifidobacterium pongonis]